ncbi:MAG TPA: hypothetical protein VGB63_16445 [Pedobacter sp.]|jgi:hypothetical protein
MANKSKELDGKIIGDNLSSLATILSDAGLCHDVGPLNHAGNFCSKNASETDYSYKFNYLEFNIPNQSGVVPALCYQLKLRFSIDITGVIDTGEDNTVKNPLKALAFDLELSGVGLTEEADEMCLHSSWHLDKHIRGEKDGATKFSHPEYHLAFGGHKMEANDGMYGGSLIMPTPRLAYPPMDAALGINFILQNYFHKDTIASVLLDPIYQRIIVESQERLFIPYAKSFYSNWFNTGLKFEKFFQPGEIFPLLIN